MPRRGKHSFEKVVKGDKSSKQKESVDDGANTSDSDMDPNSQFFRGVRPV